MGTACASFTARLRRLERGAIGTTTAEVAHEAFETRETFVRAVEDDEAAAADGKGGQDTVTVPGTIVDDVVTIIVVRTAERRDVGEAVIRPLEFLTAHAATAIGNIRSRERLVRA